MSEKNNPPPPLQACGLGWGLETHPYKNLLQRNWKYSKWKSNSDDTEVKMDQQETAGFLPTGTNDDDDDDEEEEDDDNNTIRNLY